MPVVPGFILIETYCPWLALAGIAHFSMVNYWADGDPFKQIQ